MQKRILPIIAILILVAFLLTQLNISDKYVETDANFKTQNATIVLDAGHGGLTNTID